VAECRSERRVAVQIRNVTLKWLPGSPFSALPSLVPLAGKGTALRIRLLNYWIWPLTHGRPGGMSTNFGRCPSAIPSAARRQYERRFEFGDEAFGGDRAFDDFHKRFTGVFVDHRGGS
jgi:hypothetical protein